MKKRLIITNAIIIFVSLMALLTALCFVINSENNRRNEDEIHTYLNIAANVFDGENFEETIKVLTLKNNDLRLTIIDSEGNVECDSFSLISENHLNRPEIKNLDEVFYRYSDTSSIDMAYVACLDDGYYLRVAIPRKSLNNIITYSLIIGCGSLIIILGIAVISVYFLTKNIYIPIVDELNKTRALIGSNDDIKGNDIEQIQEQIQILNSALREKIALIEKENEKIDFILNQIQNGLIIINSDGIIELINEFAAKIFLFKIDEIINHEYVYLTTNKEIIDAIDNVIKNKNKTNVDLTINGKTFLISLIPINVNWISNLNKFAVSLVIVDVTSEREIQSLKSEFFANASHELKSPLTSIIGYQQLIKEGILSSKEEIMDAVNRTIFEANRMNNLIVEMLDLSRLELKEKKIIKEVDMANLLEDLLLENSFLITNKKIKVIKNISPCKLLLNEGDAEKMVNNLLTNAIKYNVDNGEIKIILNQNHLVISDTGIGISKDDLNNIFKRFYRVDKNQSKKLGGTGLGLSIVKHVAKNYNYKIKVQSSLKQGSTFEIIFKK